jgi:hypothetical protein
MCGRILPILLAEGRPSGPPLRFASVDDEPPKRHDAGAGLRPDRVASSVI